MPEVQAPELFAAAEPERGSDPTETTSTSHEPEASTLPEVKAPADTAVHSSHVEVNAEIKEIEMPKKITPMVIEGP